MYYDYLHKINQYSGSILCAIQNEIISVISDKWDGAFLQFYNLGYYIHINPSL